MLWSFDVFFYEYIINSKGFAGFTSGAFKLLRKLLRVSYDSHTSAAASCRRFEHYGIAAFLCKFQSHLHCRNSLCNPGNRRHSRLCCSNFGFHLVSHAVHHHIVRPYKYNARLLTGSCKLRILRKKPVAWMYGVNALCLCQLYDSVYRKIRINR